MSALLPFGYWVIRRAARYLPEYERVEAQAEWLGHLEELSKDHLRLWHLIGVWRYAQMSALRSALERTTRSKVQDLLIYALWSVSCMALFLDYKIGSSFGEIFPHLLGAIFLCRPALRFVLKPLDERKTEQAKKDRPGGSA